MQIGQQKLFSYASAPNWPRKQVRFRHAQVATWELVAALSTLWSLLSLVLRASAWTEVHLFVDSSVVLGTLLHGSSRQTDWNASVAEI